MFSVDSSHFIHELIDRWEMCTNFKTVILKYLVSWAPAVKLLSGEPHWWQVNIRVPAMAWCNKPLPASILTHCGQWLMPYGDRDPGQYYLK